MVCRLWLCKSCSLLLGARSQLFYRLAWLLSSIQSEWLLVVTLTQSWDQGVVPVGSFPHSRPSRMMVGSEINFMGCNQHRQSWVSEC